MYSEFFITEQHGFATEVGYTYVYWLAVLSYAVAAFASYTAFHLVERFVTAQDRAARTKWLVIGAVSMGGGIWSMHFVAMLAVQMNMGAHARYDVLLTALSAVFAMVASGFAFSFIGKKSRGLGQLLLAGTILGAGIGAMHYTGMTAMRMDAIIRYDPLWFGVSIIVAVLLASLALRLMSFTIEANENDKPDHRLITALIMGLAITFMHYTGMFATSFLITSQPAHSASDGIALNDSVMGSIIVGVSFVMLAMAWLAANIDQKKDVRTLTLQNVGE